MIFEMLKAILLGIVQGITEWLPISSTGHMILLNEILSLKVFDNAVINKEFVDMFFVIIQLGSIFAVIYLYFDKLNPFVIKKSVKLKKQTCILWVKVLIASLPAAIIGLLFDDYIDAFLYKAFPVAIALIVYGILFIVIENKTIKPKMESLSQISYQTAIQIGLFQMLALIPGTSRSGSTILGALLIGVSRPVASEFSFFMAIPVMFGASLLKLIKLNIAFTALSTSVLIVGMLIAFVVSIIVIKMFMSYIQKHNFKVFGYYRIALGIIVILAVMLKFI